MQASSQTPRGLGEVVTATLLITPSGALSPGFLTASAIAVGSVLGWLGGFMVSLGHVLFELPYVALLVYSAERLEAVLRRLEKPLALLSAAMGLYLAYSLVGVGLGALSAGRVEMPSIGFHGGGLLTALALGFWFTGFNPYFLAWWVTIGLPLVRGAAIHGWRGFGVMYLSHVWIDFAWLTVLAAVGGGLAGAAVGYGVLMLALAVMLAVFSVDMLSRSFARRRLLPF
jgi:threonine/homoserine/homoserine lactone efflux protein